MKHRRASDVSPWAILVLLNSTKRGAAVSTHSMSIS
jgi:hypothetical protein